MKISLQARKRGGHCQINIRLSHQKNVKLIPTKFSCLPSQWDTKRQEVKNVKPLVLNHEINAELRKILMDAAEHLDRLKVQGTPLDVEILKEAILGDRKSMHDFLSFAEELNQRDHERGAISNFQKNQAVLTKLKEFYPKEILPFEALNHQFLSKFATFCRTKKQNKESTIEKNIKFFRKVINQAVLEGMVKSNPTDGFRIKVIMPERTYLTLEEVKAFESVRVESVKDQKAKDVFLFSAKYTGLRVSDLIGLKVKDIQAVDSDWWLLRFRTKKTSKMQSIFLSRQGREFIEPYCKGKSPSDYVFEFYKGRPIHFADPVQELKDLKCIVAYYNKQLSKLAKRAGITKHVSSHVARHTYSTLWLQMGNDPYALSKLLGHSTIKQTEHYAHLPDARMKESILRMSF
jgi:integrase/recombinase XerD